MSIDINKVIRKTKDEKRTIAVNVKVTPTESEWMGKHNVSPSLLFREALAELMVDQNKQVPKPTEVLKQCWNDIKTNHPLKKTKNKYAKGIADSLNLKGGSTKRNGRPKTRRNC